MRRHGANTVLCKILAYKLWRATAIKQGLVAQHVARDAGSCHPDDKQQWSNEYKVSVYGRGGGEEEGGSLVTHVNFLCGLRMGAGVLPACARTFFSAFVAPVFFSAPTDFSLEGNRTMAMNENQAHHSVTGSPSCVV